MKNKKRKKKGQPKVKVARALTVRLSSVGSKIKRIPSIKRYK